MTLHRPSYAHSLLLPSYLFARKFADVTAECKSSSFTTARNKENSNCFRFAGFTFTGGQLHHFIFNLHELAKFTAHASLF